MLKTPHISIYVFCLFIICFLFSCVGFAPTKEIQLIDSLNNKAYNYKYKDLDSSFYYANKAFQYSNIYAQGKAEACNNLAFCSLMMMDFERSEQLFKDVYNLTQNELERLIADVGLMSIYQKVSMNKEFFDYRNKAIKRMKRIQEDSSVFTDEHELIRLNYAFTEFYLVSTVYYYYLQQRTEAIDALSEVRVDDVLRKDTNQYLYYNYIKGSDGLCIPNGNQFHKLCEFDELYSTLVNSYNGNYEYFTGSCLLNISELLIPKDNFELIYNYRLTELENFDLPVDSLLPLKLSQLALQAFVKYGGKYQEANTYVTISKFLNYQGHYVNALDTLTKALQYVNRHHEEYYNENIDSIDKLYPYFANDSLYAEMKWIEHEKIKTIPEWILRIREQLSVSYAGQGLKKESDYNRNIYLDILNDTRQDKELENRFNSLEDESRMLSIILFMIIIGLLLVVVLFYFFNKHSKKRYKIYIERLQKTLALCRDITSNIPVDYVFIQSRLNNLFGKDKVLIISGDNCDIEIKALLPLNRDELALIHILKPYIEWVSNYEHTNSLLIEEREQLEKQKYIFEQHIINGKRQNIIKKTCLAIATGITPFIDRILNEVNKLISKGFINRNDVKKEKFTYIDELVTKINEYNDILAIWIKMKQGALKLNIETFDLDDLFEIIGKGKRTFESKKQKLTIETSNLSIKADKALTLFMINTLAENARKYTQQGGLINIYAKQYDDYVEISIEDNGRGLSDHDIALIRDEKIYDSKEIGVNDLLDENDTLLLSKGSGFGLMNCKGIIEKYKKTNPIFKNCLFGVDSKLNVGSRFYFRLPAGIRKTLYSFLILVLSSFSIMSCQSSEFVNDVNKPKKTNYDNEEYNSLLNKASDYANAAYFSNIEHNYKKTLLYADSAMMLLNEHYDTYSNALNKEYMQLISKVDPAELSWWNGFFETDYHIILDIRNEAAVAYLALKQLEGYNYNNNAYTALYKLQSEDLYLESYCRQLERSSINKIVGIILCVLLLIIIVIGYYILYIRKRILNQQRLEQVLEINKQVLSASLIGDTNNAEALQKEEDVLNDIPQYIVQKSFKSISELFDIDCLTLAVFNKTAKKMIYASEPKQTKIPEIIMQCYDSQSIQYNHQSFSIPLIVDVGSEHQCVGVLYFNSANTFEREDNRLLAELIAKYVAIVVYNAIIKIALQYRDIESAHEDTQRASWEDNMLHVQNMVLDNCLSTIKHETIYYPNKIKQIINKLTQQNFSEKEELDNIESICELIDYYKGIFTILTSCASRQLADVTFRRATIKVNDLCEYAAIYVSKLNKKHSFKIEFSFTTVDKTVIGDVTQLRFLLENLINESFGYDSSGIIRMVAIVENDFIRFLYTDTRRKKNISDLNNLFYPSLTGISSISDDQLQGYEYLICKQIIREHDEYAGRRGCRINAELNQTGGFTVYFTLPAKN